MELKLQCDCGQKYKFDVEPVNGQMPFAVNCPSCGVDGTTSANTILSSMPPALPAAPARVRIKEAPQLVGTTPPPVPVSAPRPAVPGSMPARAKPAGEFNMGMGVLGAFLGAALGAGLMYGFFVMAGFRFPLLGVGIGALTGYGAKLLYKGTSNGLGVVAGGVAVVAVVGTLFLIYGEFYFISIISVVISVSMAYRIASS